MNTLKMYIPISVVKQEPVNVVKRLGFIFNHRQQQMKPVIKTTLINTASCPLVSAQLPAMGDVAAHLTAQQVRMAEGKPYVSITVGVIPDLYAELCREITHVSHVNYQIPVINVVLELGQPPLVQIMGNHVTERRFKRTIPPSN